MSDPLLWLWALLAFLGLVASVLVAAGALAQAHWAEHMKRFEEHRAARDAAILAFHDAEQRAREAGV